MMYHLYFILHIYSTVKSLRIYSIIKVMNQPNTWLDSYLTGISVCVTPFSCKLRYWPLLLSFIQFPQVIWAKNKLLITWSRGHLGHGIKGMWYLRKVASLYEQFGRVSPSLCEMIEKIKTYANRLLLFLIMKKKFSIYFSKIELFSISKPKVVYQSPFLSSLPFFKFWKENFIYFRDKHV